MLARRPRPPYLAILSSLQSTRSASTVLYDRLADSSLSKINRLTNPDPRFLRFSNSHPTPIDYTPTLSLPETRLTTLPTGLRIATESSPEARTATVGVWIDTGSRFETDETHGTAYFLEHMLFRARKNWREKKREQEIESMGAHVGGHTAREQTSYYVKVMEKDVNKAVAILADIIQNSCFRNPRFQKSSFDETLLEKERNIVLQEMKAGEEQTTEIIFDHLHATAFQHTPLGRTVLGPAQNIEKITWEHLKSYMTSHFTAHRMVISAAGAVKHEDIIEQAKTLFEDLSPDPTMSHQLVAKEPAIFTGSEVRTVDDDVPLAQFAVAFRGASWKDPDLIALMVMQSMLGSWDKNAEYGHGKHMGSELTQRIAINDIAESITAYNINYKDTGLFGVYAIAKPDCLDDLAHAIMYEISMLSYRVSEDDVTLARNQVKSSMLLYLDSTGAVAEDIGRQFLNFGRRIPVNELFARIDAVDSSTVKRVANQFIFDQDLAIAAMGPIRKLPDYNWFRRRTYLLRY